MVSTETVFLKVTKIISIWYSQTANLTTRVIKPLTMEIGNTSNTNPVPKPVLKPILVPIAAASKQYRSQNLYSEYHSIGLWTPNSLFDVGMAQDMFHQCAGSTCSAFCKWYFKSLKISNS
ncbi:hypothetical protein STEG23_029634 [Scotinomys teguina]